jgi:hypothetical protein
MDYSIHINKYKYGEEIREPLLEKTSNNPNDKNDNKINQVIYTNVPNLFLLEKQVSRERAQANQDSSELNLRLIFLDNNLLIFLTIGTILSFLLIIFLLFIYK